MKLLNQLKNILKWLPLLVAVGEIAAFALTKLKSIDGKETDESGQGAIGI